MKTLAQITSDWGVTSTAMIGLSRHSLSVEFKNKYRQIGRNTFAVVAGTWKSNVFAYADPLAGLFDRLIWSPITSMARPEELMKILLV